VSRYPGTVYLIHFDRPIGNHARPNRVAVAQHYIGHAAPGQLLERVAEDFAGGCRAPKIMQYAARAGVVFQLARLWEGGHDLERRLKRRGGASRLCPLCGVRPRVVPVTRGPEAARRPPWWPEIGAPRPRSAAAVASSALIGAAAAAGWAPPY
jgi:hypothetical protein